MTVPTVADLMAQTAISNGIHRWAVEGGLIEVAADELLPILDQAYDANMPDWASLVSYDDGSWHVA
jgi:hypothetical protein